MPEKDTSAAFQFIEWLRQITPYFTTIFLSIWGGVVNHIQTLRAGKKKFQWKELIFDLIASTFAGLLTFYFCRSAGISETKAAILIAVSGHMGTRAIAGFEMTYRRVIGR
jgi:uncharacterized membrane protein HdeD (DUF308 family)